jgi:hypothetical protein
VAYLHTPDGFGRSKLGEKFDKGIGVVNSARNWNTVLKWRQSGRTRSRMNLSTPERGPREVERLGPGLQLDPFLSPELCGQEPHPFPWLERSNDRIQPLLVHHGDSLLILHGSVESGTGRGSRDLDFQINRGLLIAARGGG